MSPPGSTLQGAHRGRDCGWGGLSPSTLKRTGLASASAASQQGSQGAGAQGKLNGADTHGLWAVDCSTAEAKRTIEAPVAPSEDRHRVRHLGTY